MYVGGFTWKERRFFAFAWTPKVCFTLGYLAAFASLPYAAIFVVVKAATRKAAALCESCHAAC